LVLAHFTKEVVFLGFDAFEKIKCIFSIAPVGNLEKLRALIERWCWQHRTLVQSVRCGVCGAGVHRTHRSESGGQRPTLPLCARVR